MFQRALSTSVRYLGALAVTAAFACSSGAVDVEQEHLATAESELLGDTGTTSPPPATTTTSTATTSPSAPVDGEKLMAEWDEELAFAKVKYKAAFYTGTAPGASQVLPNHSAVYVTLHRRHVQQFLVTKSGATSYRIATGASKLVATKATTNHGTAASDVSMSSVGDSAGTPWTRVPVAPCPNGDCRSAAQKSFDAVVDNACDPHTAYCGVDPANGKLQNTQNCHVCNNDSYYQMACFRFGVCPDDWKRYCATPMLRAPQPGTY